MLRQFPAARGCKCGFPLGFGEWRVYLSVVVRLLSPGPRGEIGQLTQQHVEFYSAALHRNLLDALAPRGIGRGTQEPQRLPRVGIRDHDWRGDEFTALEAYA